MTFVLSGMIAVVMIAGYFFAIFRMADKRHKYPVGSFGDLKADEVKPDKERQALLHEYSRQQRRTFALVWVTISVGALLSVALVIKVAIRPELDLAMLSSVVGLVGDLSICKASFRLYQDSSRRLERLFASGVKSGPK